MKSSNLNITSKRLLSMSMALLFVLSFSAAFAQDNKKGKQETIIIEDDKSGNKNTTIEIKNGEVFIDGKKITDGVNDKDRNVKIIKKKVIINGKELNDDETQSFNFNFGDMDNIEMTSNKPMLGVTTKQSKNIDGAEVESVVPNSPAQKMGLQTGDIITRINDRNIQTPNDLLEAVNKFKPGNEVEITYERDNKLATKSVKLSEKKDATVYSGTMPFDMDIFKQFENMENPYGENPYRNNPFGNNPYLENPFANNSPKIGVNVEDTENGKGVVVRDVVENSAAQKAGIAKEDVITTFNSKEIGNVDDLLDAIGEAKGKDKVSMDIIRSGAKRQITITMPKNLKKRDL